MALAQEYRRDLSQRDAGAPSRVLAGIRAEEEQLESRRLLFRVKVGDPDFRPELSAGEMLDETVAAILQAKRGRIIPQAPRAVRQRLDRQRRIKRMRQARVGLRFLRQSKGAWPSWESNGSTSKSAMWTAHRAPVLYVRVRRWAIRTVASAEG